MYRTYYTRIHWQQQRAAAAAAARGASLAYRLYSCSRYCRVSEFKHDRSRCWRCIYRRVPVSRTKNGTPWNEFHSRDSPNHALGAGYTKRKWHLLGSSLSVNAILVASAFTLRPLSRKPASKKSGGVCYLALYTTCSYGDALHVQHRTQ